MIEERPDEPHRVAKHENRFAGGVGLIVLGGPSGRAFQHLYNRISPDVVITVNGATQIPGADYWLLAENMHYSHNLAKKGYERERGKLAVFASSNTARFRFVSHRSFDLLPLYGIDRDSCVKIRRFPLRNDFSVRKYGEGLLAGPISEANGWRRKVDVRLGTVGAQALHVAGILGCRQVHTVGFDLLLPEDAAEPHHWYTYPQYEPDRFRNDAMFVEFAGRRSLAWWVETAEWLADVVRPRFALGGLEWIDHSGGLFRLMDRAWAH